MVSPGCSFPITENCTCPRVATSKRPLPSAGVIRNVRSTSGVKFCWPTSVNDTSSAWVSTPASANRFSRILPPNSPIFSDPPFSPAVGRSESSPDRLSDYRVAASSDRTTSARPSATGTPPEKDSEGCDRKRGGAPSRVRSPSELRSARISDGLIESDSANVATTSGSARLPFGLQAPCRGLACHPVNNKR